MIGSRGHSQRTEKRLVGYARDGRGIRTWRITYISPRWPTQQTKQSFVTQVGDPLKSNNCGAECRGLSIRWETHGNDVGAWAVAMVDGMVQCWNYEGHREVQVKELGPTENHSKSDLLRGQWNAARSRLVESARPREHPARIRPLSTLQHQ